MSGDYTPTTAEVADAWVASYKWPDGTRLQGRGDRYSDEFYRWLAAHDRAVKAEAFREAADEVGAWGARCIPAALSLRARAHALEGRR